MANAKKRTKYDKSELKAILRNKGISLREASLWLRRSENYLSANDGANVGLPTVELEDIAEQYGFEVEDVLLEAATSPVEPPKTVDVSEDILNELKTLNKAITTLIYSNANCERYLSRLAKALGDE